VSPRPLEVRIEGGLPSETDEGGVSVGFLAALPPGREALSRDGRSYLSDSTRADGGRSTLPPVWREVDVVVAQFGPAWASHPTPVPRSGPLRIALEPAGLVVVVPDRLDSEAAGVLTLRHEDGRPVEHSSSTDSVIEFTVEAGTLLGPLPAGSHRFHVRRGGRPLGSVDVDVVAGRVVPLLLSD
jgi:hypothetical protein